MNSAMSRTRALCILAVCALTASAGAGDPPPVPLRVVTHNLKDGLGARGTLRAQTFAKFLGILDYDGAGPLTSLVPDVLLLQEVEQSTSIDLTHFVVDYLPGYQIRTAAGDGFNFNATIVRPDITIVSSSSLNVGGPRGVVKTKLDVPGALRDLVVYNAHFKAGGQVTDQNQRRNEANASGNNVSFEVNFGNVNVLFAGDLNSNNNSDGTITGLFFTSTNPITPSGILNLPVESLFGRTSPSTLIATFPGSGSRLDYICLDDQLTAHFDTVPLGSLTQEELNSMGFVYYSNDDAGAQASGDSTATNIYSDHRPVVFDIYLPRDPMVPYYEPKDVSEDSVVNAEDLYRWETSFALGVLPAQNPAPDIDGNRNIDLTDRNLIRACVRENELADITTN